MPALKAAIEDLKAGRLQAGWEKLEHYGVIKEITDGLELRQRAVEQHLEALRIGKTSLMISPRHDEARKVAAIVRPRGNSSGGGNGTLGGPLSIRRSLPYKAGCDIVLMWKLSLKLQRIPSMEALSLPLSVMESPPKPIP